MFTVGEVEDADAFAGKNEQPGVGDPGVAWQLDVAKVCRLEQAHKLRR